MNLKHEINRLSHLFNDGVDKVQTATDDWGDKAKSKAKTTAGRARHGLETGGKRLMSAEERIVRHVRSNPGLYIVAAVLLIGMMVAKLMMETGDNIPSAPLD